MAAALGFRSPSLPWNLRSLPDARGLVPLRPSPSPPPPPLVSGRFFFPLHKEDCAPSPRSLVAPFRCHGGGPERLWREKSDELEPDEILEREVVRTLLIDNYDSYTYNIYQELSVVNGVPPVVIRNDEWTWEYMYHCLYEKRDFDNIVISPGPGTPACPKDVGICLRVLHDCKDIPILGVCLGHQALGFVHGAHVVHAPEPIHGRLSEIEHSDCNLFSKIPSGVRSGFKVVRYHSLAIDPESLPKELIPTAWTASLDTLSFLETQKNDMIRSPGNDMSRFEAINQVGEDNVEFKTKVGIEKSNEINKTKVLMGIMHSTRPHYGVQFHPESVGTQHGRQIFKNFKKITLDYGLRKLKRHDRQVDNIGKAKVSHACQSVEELSMSKLACETTAMRQSDVFRASMLAVKGVDLKHLKLKWIKIDSILDQAGGSENIFRKLFGDHKADDTFWLDSSSTDKNRARFSFMGGRGGSLWKQLTFRLSQQRTEHSSNQNGNGKRILNPEAGGYLTIRDFHESSKTIFLEDGFFDFLKKELQLIHYDKTDFDGLPFDFFGGFVGYLGYGLKVECGASFNKHRSETPDACFFFADKLVVIDHLVGDVYILSLNNNSGSDGMDNNNRRDYSWLYETEQRLLKLRAESTKKLNRKKMWDAKPVSSNVSFKVEKSRNQYINDVGKCLELIRDGESYELCLTTQMRKSVGNVDMLKLYLDLRNKNPAPYAAWLNFSSENLCICCSSPERFLQLDRDNILEAKPIKGTIARGRTPEEDERLRLQLQYSEKDQAENLMIVDLLRNDLGQVCEPGSVHVPRLMEVESYATVHTLVSTIQGRRKSDVTAIDCVRAAFPGGSMTGAPKLRSMEILDSLESSSRGIYSGCIGFFSYNQTFDLNIVIRTVVMHKGEASVGAGGAIVALSQPEDEYAEMMLKAKAPTTIIEDYSEDIDFCGSSMTMVI